MTYPWTTGQVLTAADLNAYAGLVHVKTETVGTGVSSVSVTNCFSSAFDNYKIVVAIEDSTGNNAVVMQMGATNTGYYWANYGYRYTGAVFNSAAENDSSWQLGGVGVDGLFCVINVMNPNAAKVTAISLENVYMRTSTGYVANAGGWLNNTTQYTGFTISQADDFTGGTIRVYGYNNG